ncbi:MAG: CoA pyrophosphatase [Chloroflexi bacterium]|nr:CoA pyrophosphatase [Chloroflexota bacterium]
MLFQDLERALALPRPGRAAQMQLAPRPRWGGAFPQLPEIRPKEAGVLILVYPGADDLRFFLTRRTDTVETHKGQISLPGGARHNGESLAQTARRETREELGIGDAAIETLGDALTPLFIPISGFRATPFVAFTPARPEVRASAGEVVEIIEPPLTWIADDQHIVEEEWTIRGFPAIVPYFAINGHKVWGATAMILGELRAMLRNVIREM